MPELEPVDLVLTDPPYGITACSWDLVIPLKPMWKQINKIIKPNAAIVLTASQPFTSALVMSNPKMFKYEWIWEKAVGSNFTALKYQPMKEHESIIVFSKKTHNYYPIFELRKGNGTNRTKQKFNKSQTTTGETSGCLKNIDRTGRYGELRNPSSIQFFNNREKSRGLHPTQKPTAMMEYFISTYTLPADIVLDFCIGSGTTAIACEKLNRRWIGIEIEEKYCEITKKGIINETRQLKFKGF